MTCRTFLIIAIPGAAIPVLVIIFLPSGISPTYISFVEPLSLLVGSILALYVSFIYRKQLKAAFAYLAVYLFIYMLANILVPYLQPHLGRSFNIFLVSVQAINYAMLISFCVNLLRVMDLKRLDWMGWIFFSLFSIFAMLVAIYPVWPLIGRLTHLDLATILYIAIRVIDAGLVIALAPVVWLYIQYLKSQQRQSLAFTVIIAGIMWTTISDYILEFFSGVPLSSLTNRTVMMADVADMLYLYGYLVIAIGLYAHLKQDDWGFRLVDRAMSPKPEPGWGQAEHG